MLFDLRSRGRRRAVKTIYVFLAVLMGSGLILFGIGGATSGGLLNALGNGSGGSGGSSSNVPKTIAHLEALVARNKANSDAWDRLAKARFTLALSDANNYDQSTGSFTTQGKAALRPVSQAWNGYLASHPKKIDNSLVNQMLAVYQPQGLDQPAQLVKLTELQLAHGKPTVHELEVYSTYASLAGQTRKAQLAQTQAEELAATGKTGKARTKAITAVKQAIALNEAELSPQSSTTTTPATIPNP